MRDPVRPTSLPFDNPPVVFSRRPKIAMALVTAVTSWNSRPAHTHIPRAQL
jgi:hypothetical protein